MELIRKQEELMKELSAITGAQERLAYLLERSRNYLPLEKSLKTDVFKVEGCHSNLWLVPEFREGKCFYRADSDSMIVRSIAGLLCELYSGHSPEEIIHHEPTFLRDVGITQHLSPNRRNGLSRVWEKIQGFAASKNQSMAA